MEAFERKSERGKLFCDILVYLVYFRVYFRLNFDLDCSVVELVVVVVHDP